MVDSIQIIGSKGTGGAENFYARLCLALHESGDQVLAITPPACPVQRQIERQLPVSPVAMRGNWDIFSKWQIRKIIRQQGAPIVQTWMGRATRLTDVRDLAGVTHIARLGGYYNLKAYRHADAWIGNTKGICDYLIKQGLAKDRVFHISNFYETQSVCSDTDLQKLRKNLRLEDDAQILFSLGRLHINKGFDVMLRAFADLLEKSQTGPCYLLIAGEGPLRAELHNLTKMLGLTEKVKWLGWIDEPAAYFQLADVFVCPSRHEPLGNVVLEAWGNQTAVIACDIQGPAELITQGEDGLLVENENIAQMSRAMSELLRDKNRAADLAQAGRESLEKEFNVEKIRAEYQQLYASFARQG